MTERLVLIRRSALGDVVLVGSVTAAWRGPVSVVTDRRWHDLVLALPGVDQVLDWDAVVTGEQPLPVGQLVDLQGSLRSLQLCLRTGRRFRRIRKRSVRRRLQLAGMTLRPRPSVPQLYGAAVGVAPQAPPWLSTGALREGLVVIPGAAWWPKQWGGTRFREVVERWDGPVTVLGGPGEEELCAEVAGDHAEVCCERGFEQTLTVLRHAQVVLAGDTGLGHLASACGAPLVSIFGPTSPRDGFAPYAAEVIEREVSCRPCALHRVTQCRVGDHRCMSIEVDRVLRALREAACAG